MKIFRSQRGISIVGAIFTLIILGIFGATIVVLVTTEQETRVGQIEQEWAFYNIQAGLEYAIKEIDLGHNPIVSNKSFGSGSFSTAVNYDEVSAREIIVASTVGDAQSSHQISYDSFGADCLEANNDTVTLVGPGKTDLKGMTLRRTCNQAVTIDKMIISWDPEDDSEKATQIVMKNDTVWEDADGLPSGSLFDINDTILTGPVAYQVNLIRFNANMLHKVLTIKFIMSDTSTNTLTFEILPPGL